jgi:hypothetical protein
MKIALIWLTLLSSFALAQVTPSTNEQPISGEIVCPTSNTGNALGFCYYTVKNLNRAQALIAKVNQALFQGVPLISSRGILQPFGENEQQVMFWHSDPIVLDNMKTVIPLLDTKENFTTYSIVEVRTDIYEISETGLSSLGAEISNLKFGTLFNNDDADEGYGLTGTRNGMGLDLRLGTFELQGLISAERSRGTLNRKGTIVRTIPNLTNLTYSDTTTIYIAPGAGTNVLQPKTGIELGGKVSINDIDSSLINIKDFNLYYGTLVESGDDKLVNAVTVPYENMVLEEGVSFPILSSKTIGTMKVKKRGFLGFGNVEETEDTKLLVYVSAKVYEWNEYLNSVRALVEEPKFKFSDDEKKELSNTCVNDLEVLNDLQLHAKRDQLGDPVLNIKFDKDLACLDNINRRVKITISGEDIDENINTTMTTFERAMHMPIRIKGIMPRKFTQSSLKFKVKLETYGPIRSKVVKRLEFAPTSYDLEGMFWINR